MYVIEVEPDVHVSSDVRDVLAEVKAKNAAEPEFHQAVLEVLESLDLVFERRPEYRTAKIMERKPDTGRWENALEKSRAGASWAITPLDQNAAVVARWIAT